MTNPTVLNEYTDFAYSNVLLGKHVIAGRSSVVLPGVTLGEGVAVGAISFVNRNYEAFGIYVGNTARRVKKRIGGLLELEQQFMAIKVQ